MPAHRDEGLAIRRAGAGDLDVIDAIETASFDGDRFPRRNLARLLRSPSAALLIAERGAGGRPAGYVAVLFRRGTTTARLYSLAAAPGARGEGVGAALVQAAARCAIEGGADRLRLEVRRANVAAIRLYERSGFRIRKIMPGYYTDGETALQMEMLLDTGARS